MHFYEGPLLGFDTETTGVDTSDPSVRVVTCAMVYSYPPQNGHDPVIREWLLNPEVEIPEGASNVHGITTERAVAEGGDYRLGLQSIADAFSPMIRQGVPLVAYNASYDISLLRNEFIRHNIRFDPALWDQAIVIDPYVFDKVFDKYRRGKRTLGIVASLYGYSLDNAHDATADVLAALHLARAMLQKMVIDDTEPTGQELVQYQKVQYAEQMAGLEVHFRKTDPTATVNRDWPYKQGEVNVPTT